MSTRINNIRSRRGAAVVVVVLILMAMQLVAVLALRASSDESDLATRRVVTTRAFFAAEAGGTIAARNLRQGIAAPKTGTVLTLSGSKITFASSPGGASTGTVVIDGSADSATRRIRVDVDTQVR